MNETVRTWIEIGFNITYLVVIWSIVLLMVLRRAFVTSPNKLLSQSMMAAFALLALGDTGHVGFRVIAYARGGLEANPVLVGLGAFSTACTVTLFYMLLVEIWRRRFHQPFGRFAWFLMATGIVRLIVMIFPQNGWQQITTPYDWSLLRNAFLVVQGLGVMFLILRDATRFGDSAFRWMGIMIALSYAFYTPVILWVQWQPLLGMLMIPKTCAYLGVAFIAYHALYRQPSAEPIKLQPAGQSIPALPRTTRDG